jgi:predicted enzyme related to lactoylglutathione lyase
MQHEHPVPGRVTWFEIAATDPETIAGFYSGLFGWQPQGDPAIYLSIAPSEGGGLPGGILPAATDVGPYGLFGVEVDDVDAAHDRDGRTEVRGDRR